MSTPDETIAAGCSVAWRGLRFAIADYAKHREKVVTGQTALRHRDAEGRIKAYVDVLKAMTGRTEVDIIETAKRRALKDGLLNELDRG